MNTANTDENYRAAQIRVHARLKFYRDIITYVVVVSGLFVLDWLTGGDWWVQWVAGIWGGLLLLDALNVFVLRTFFGKEREERMIQNELRRRDT